MAAAGGAASAPSDLECALCRGRLQAPVFLDCLHSVCQRHTLEGTEIVCGVCATRVAVAKDRAWVRDVLSELLLERAGSESAESKCENCEMDVPMWFCNTCASALCQPCYTAVHSAPVFRKHQLVSFSEREMPSRRWLCDLHAKPIEFFNPETQKPACVGCLLGGALSPKRVAIAAGADDKKRLGRSRSAQTEDNIPTSTLLIPDKFVPLTDAVRIASEELAQVQTQSEQVIARLREGLQLLQSLSPQLAANFEALEDRIEKTFMAYQEELRVQEIDCHAKASHVLESKDRLLKSRQHLVASRLRQLETLQALVNRLTSVRDGESVVLSLKAFVTHQFADAMISLLGPSVKVSHASLLKNAIDVAPALLMPSVNFDWTDVQSPMISLQNELGQAKAHNDNLSQRLRVTHSSLQAHQHQVKQLQLDVATLRQNWLAESTATMTWIKSRLHLLLSPQMARLVPRWHAKRALTAMEASSTADKTASSPSSTSDSTPAASVDDFQLSPPFPNDLYGWAELRSEQASAVSDLQRIASRLHSLQMAVQEFNRDVTVRRCRPSSGAVTSVVGEIRNLKSQVTATHDDLQSLTPQLVKLWNDLRTTILSEEQSMRLNMQQLEEVESDYQTLADGVEHIQQVYELLSSRNTEIISDTQGYLEQIRDVKPDSSKRLQALQTAGYEREKERLKAENQMEAGLRDGIRLLRHTGGLEALRKTRSMETLVLEGTPQ